MKSDGVDRRMVLPAVAPEHENEAEIRECLTSLLRLLAAEVARGLAADASSLDNGNQKGGTLRTRKGSPGGNG